MKKLFSVIGYFILSLFLFLGGVLLEAAPSSGEAATVSDISDNQDDKPDDNPADPGDSSDTQEPAVIIHSWMRQTKDITIRSEKLSRQRRSQLC